MTPKRFAVYGTLRKGYGNHRLLKNSKYLGTEKTTPNYEMYNVGWFPALVPGNESVVIEVYEVDDPHTMASLDRLEGANRSNPERGMYRAETIETSHGIADIYIWNSSVSGLKKIESGDFTKL